MKPTGNHCPRCDVMIPRGRLACRRDWYALPGTIRDAINATYTPGQDLLTATAEYLDALKDALAWYRDHPLQAAPK